MIGSDTKPQMPGNPGGIASSTVPRVLVVDDEAHLRELLEITLIKMGLDVDSAESLTAARSYLTKYAYSLVLTDMRLPDGSGIELVQEIVAQHKATPVAVITAFGSADNAVLALKAGAFDYVSKPVALDQLRKLVRSALQTNIVQAKDEAVVEAMPATLNASFLLGGSSAIQHVRGQIVRLARSMAPVIITGESGSGKELAAREIHRHSARQNKPFIAVNCGAIPETLMEAEFFGYRKGAFTGAVDDRDGFFQAANGGTLMLDEVADLPLAMQVKLLRAIQERRVRKVGATTEEPVDVRIISATHQNLAERVETGKFRQDLYYRLNVIELHLPPLRDRLEDIGELAAAILKRLSLPDDVVGLHEDVLHALANYEFPGNVRELENILERALAFANHGCIQVSDLALRIQPQLQRQQSSVAVRPQIPTGAMDAAISISTDVAALSSDVARISMPRVAENAAGKLPEGLSVDGRSQSMVSSGNFNDVPASNTISMQQSGVLSLPGLPSLPCSLPDYLDTIERDMIRRALQQTRNNRTQAAELLGVSFRHLRYQIQKLQIQDPE